MQKKRHRHSLKKVFPNRFDVIDISGYPFQISLNSRNITLNFLINNESKYISLK